MGEQLDVECGMCQYPSRRGSEEKKEKRKSETHKLSSAVSCCEVLTRKDDPPYERRFIKWISAASVGGLKLFEATTLKVTLPESKYLVS